MEALTLERTLTELDHVRLLNLLRRDASAQGSRAELQLRAIEDMLDTCTVVPARQLTPDVVTMYTQVSLQDSQSGQRSVMTLCYPTDAEPATGFVSVLSPVGSALLGLTVGSVAHWSTPAGEAKSAEIVAVLFQPEASGDYAL